MYTFKKLWAINLIKSIRLSKRIKQKKTKYPLIVYKRFDTNGGKELVHYTVLDRDMGVVRAFLKKK
jgi:hypothetical protein